MKYTVPDYYRQFHCIASDCPDTCCAGWQIVIDDQTLKKYASLGGGFGSRLASSIHLKDRTFKQYAGRCAFLNEQNLCDIYQEAGSDMLCRICRMYPRHVEEFENEREISLSLSCPVVAREILDRSEPVRFLETEDMRTEREDSSFDLFLYSALQDCRSRMIEMLQERRYSIGFRMASVLALGHDIQNRINGGKIFEIESLLECYRKPGTDVQLRNKFQKLELTDGLSKMQRSRSLLGLLDELEVMDDSWPDQLEVYREYLFGGGENAYALHRARAEQLWADQQTCWMETESEQLMVYFLFTYFCGAVYDGNALAQVKLAVVSTLILRELELAAQIGWGMEKPVTLEERARIAWKFSRELEHSELNLNRMEELMNQDEAADFRNLLALIPGKN